MLSCRDFEYARELIYDVLLFHAVTDYLILFYGAKLSSAAFKKLKRNNLSLIMF